MSGVYTRCCALCLPCPVLKQVAIIDFDVHHGNGTEDIFYKDDSVLYISTHQQVLEGNGEAITHFCAASMAREVQPLAEGEGQQQHQCALLAG